jgi:hypothetical protein
MRGGCARRIETPATEERSLVTRSRRQRLTGRFTGPRLVRPASAAGNVPAVVRAGIALPIVVDGQCGDRRCRLRPFQPFRSRGFVAVGPEDSSVKRSTWPEAT